MKKGLLSSYIAGILDKSHGDSLTTILRYFAPEFVTAFVLYSMVGLINARWIAILKSTSMYATDGVTNTLFHFITKMAEGFLVGTVVLTGHFNGLQEFKKVGKSLIDAFWVTIIVGLCITALLFFGAEFLYGIYGIPEKMIKLGVPYLRIRSMSVLFMFVYFAIVGFIRGIKKPRISMMIFILGALVFLFFDYALIFGEFGFPQMKLEGSALASVIQYGVMLFAGIAYLFFDKENRKYSINLFSDVACWSRIKELIKLSWPVMLDKSILAGSYLWLGAMINPMGKYAIASFTVIKDLERLAILPAAALAQVITFLVSNAYGLGDWQGIKSNVKKTIFLSSIFVFSILVVFSIWPEFFIGFFDQKGKFTEFSSRIFPVLSILVFFDLLQLILAASLRGAANVTTVMWTRLGVCLLYFVPISCWLAHYPIENQKLKFFIIYASFYFGSALMSIIYIYRFRGERWKSKKI